MCECLVFRIYRICTTFRLLREWQGHLKWLPAVNYDGASIWWVAGLDTSHEHQQWGRVIWDTMVRPGRELELSNFTLLREAILEGEGYSHVSDLAVLCTEVNICNRW